MQRLIEIILGLDPGFLSREGDFTVRFNPNWPWQGVIGAGAWNFLLIALAVALVVYVYRHEGRSRPARVVLGVMRGLVLALVIALLNRPVLTLGQSRTEPSVLAIMVDDSISMRVRDGAGAVGTTVPSAEPITRLDAVVRLLNENDQRLLRELRKQHDVRLYRFNRDAQPLAAAAGAPDGSADDAAASAAPQAALGEALAKLEATGQHTQVIGSLRSVLDDLQGQRVAGVVVLTDGRETPAQPLAEALAAVKDYNVKVFPVAVGSDAAPTNVEVQAVNVQDSAFVGDIVNVRATIRGTGYDHDHPVTVQLKDKNTGQVLSLPGQPPEQKVPLAAGDQPIEVELQFKPEIVGTLDLVVEAVKQAGELDDEDNTRQVQLAVLDAKIAVLYVDGYPRWEYRYIKNEMIRDRTVDISCLLTSADPSFAQEGDKPIRRFPESIEELMEYDVIVFGDVPPRQFTDAQLQLVAEFVAKRGGGFGMIAGPRWSPGTYRNTAIEPILPVSLLRTDGDADELGAGAGGAAATSASLTQGFRLQLTREGEASSIFRFFADREANNRFLKEQIQPIFWYARGIATKPGVGEVYAQHPTDVGPDGRRAPILVLGRYGAGRTLFSGIDDSWRWRFYTGESVFDTYWVQQLRYLARSKKLGQRRLTFTSFRPSYELGQQVRISLRVLDPQLMGQLPEQLRVDITDASGQVVGQETLYRQEGQPDLYVAAWQADRVGRFSVKLPPIAGGVEAMDLPNEVIVPRLELVQPQVDRTLLTRLAAETLGQTLTLAEAPKLATLIPSAAKVIPIETSQPLWDAPLALVLFVLLITAEWVTRKMYGMV